VRFTTNTGHVNENYVIRGFDVNASEVAFNGLYGLAPDSHVPTEMIERVELLKGPGALLGGMAPNGAVGGVVNVISKKPLAGDLTRLTTTFTSGSQLQEHVDVSRRFGPERRLGIRVNGALSSRTHFSGVWHLVTCNRAPAGTAASRRPSQSTTASGLSVSMSTVITALGLVTIGRANRAWALLGTTMMASRSGHTTGPPEENA
jgi:outer membrane receptor protein involved in Fe transport